MVLRVSVGRLVTPVKVISGVLSPPYATGEVLAIKHKTAARKGSKPRPTMMAPQMATRVPQPAAPSRKAPKAKAIKIAWIRASAERPATERRTTVNCPVSTVTLYRSMALKMVQPTGSNPKAAP